MNHNQFKKESNILTLLYMQIIYRLFSEQENIAALYLINLSFAVSTSNNTDEISETVDSGDINCKNEALNEDETAKFCSGLYYFNARWYDPGLGRFTTEDPIRDGLNWYIYANNNPLRFVDPSGLANVESAGFEREPVFNSPVNEARLTSAYGKRIPVTYEAGGKIRQTGNFHTGIDLAPVSAGASPIKAMDSGKVVDVRYDKNVKGYYTTVDHMNGYSSEYFHMGESPVLEEGRFVEEGHTLGFMGNTGASTGTHVHVTVRKDGETMDPVKAMGGVPEGVTLDHNHGVRQNYDGTVYNASAGQIKTEQTRNEMNRCKD